MIQDYEKKKASLEKWLALQQKKVVDNVTVVDSEMLGQDYMLHIDREAPKVFTPRIPLSAGNDEENSVARVTVAPHLIGCILGYAGVDSDVVWAAKDKKDLYLPFRGNWRGGYEISTLPFDFCVKANNKLVYDAEETDEHWLITYDEDSKKFPSTVIGVCFVTQYTLMPRSNSAAAVYMEMYAQINKPEGIRFSPKIEMPMGCHKLELSFDGPHVWGNVENKTKYEERTVHAEGDYKVTPVSQGTYNAAKARTAALLSHIPADAPASVQW